MISIVFKDENDANLLCERFADVGKNKTLRVHKDDRLVRIDCQGKETAFLMISSVLTDVVIQLKEEVLLLEQISQVFYFEDHDEQAQILSIAKSILQGKKPELPGLDEMSSRRQLVMDAFHSFIRDGMTFDYESFIRFRLKPYKQCLQHYVEMAIDEYKLEQDYQSFVEHLREMLHQRYPLLETVHLFFNQQFALYDQRYRRVDETAIYAHLDAALKSQISMDVSPSILVTLIGIAPKTLFLYTDEVDTGMIQTIQNVFQERVVICSARSCDFYSPS